MGLRGLERLCFELRQVGACSQHAARMLRVWLGWGDGVRPQVDSPFLGCWRQTCTIIEGLMPDLFRK